MIYETPWEVSRDQDIYWYHTMALPDGIREGDWDLRSAAYRYTGRVFFQGKRVIDFGTANGFLTFYAESMGADVVSIDASDDHPLELLEGWGSISDTIAGTNRIKKGYWFCHKALQSKAKVWYGNIYDLPPAMGQFDVALLGSILLHVSNPFGLLQSAAWAANTLVITDAYRPYLNTDGIIFRPANGKDDFLYWWYIAPPTIERMLRSMGFKSIKQDQFKLHSARYGTIDLVTTVASRGVL